MSQRRRHCNEPSWRPRERLRSSSLPPLVGEWLLDTSSLTRRLQELCGQGFHVEVISQHWTTASLSEASLLGLRAHRRVLLRQVFLCCGEDRWVYARTAIPETTLRGRGAELARLGNRPLGALLFADPTVSRGQLQVARLSRNQWRGMRPDLDELPGEAWGRRSLFFLGRRPLLVTEFFLPAFLVTCQAAPLLSADGPFDRGLSPFEAFAGGASSSS